MRNPGLEQRKALGVAYALELLSPDTPYGDKLRRAFHVYAPDERAMLEIEWHNVETAMDGLRTFPSQYDRIGHLLRQIRDIRGTLSNLRTETLTEVELFEVKRFLLQLAALAQLFAEVGAAYRGLSLTEERGALAVLDPDGRRSAGFTVGGPDAKRLNAIREEKRRVELSMRECAGEPAAGALKRLRESLAREESIEEESVRASLTRALRPYADALLQNTEAIGRLDLMIQKAKLAKLRGCARPSVSEDGALRLTSMELPEAADRLAARGQAFTRVSIEAPVGATVITGANMGGKSVAIRAAALNAIWCQAGYFAFAERAEIPLFDAFYLIAEDPSDTAGGLSSFGAEVLRVQRALSAVQSGAYCFVALDEPARGTNPHEGAALARALALRLSAARSVSVIATHYDGVAGVARAQYRAAALRDMPESLPPDMPGEERLRFLAARTRYGLTPVGAEAETPREALAVVRALGLDAEVVAEMTRTLGRG